MDSVWDSHYGWALNDDTTTKSDGRHTDRESKLRCVIIEVNNVSDSPECDPTTTLDCSTDSSRDNCRSCIPVLYDSSTASSSASFSDSDDSASNDKTSGSSAKARASRHRRQFAGDIPCRVFILAVVIFLLIRLFMGMSFFIDY